MGISDHLTCLLRNLYAGQEPKVRTLYGTTDWFRIEKGVQDCLLSPCLFNLHEEHIMRNAILDELQVESRLPGEISTMTGPPAAVRLREKEFRVDPIFVLFSLK